MTEYPQDSNCSSCIIRTHPLFRHLSEEEMLHEHRAEFDEISAGVEATPIPPETLRRRRRWFFSVYAFVVLVGAIVVFVFLTFTDVAIETVPPADSMVEIYAPYAPATDVPSVNVASLKAAP